MYATNFYFKDFPLSTEGFIPKSNSAELRNFADREMLFKNI